MTAAKSTASSIGRPPFGPTGRPDVVRPGGPPTPSASRLPSLTGLRFVAAFVVFGFHLIVVQFVDGGGAGTAMQWIFGQGAVGVSFFFLLSGFVLTWSARGDDTARRFWQRRFAKIYPNHVVTWVAAFVVALVTGVGVTALIAIPNLFLVQAWFPDPRIHYGMNTVAWSLACEVFFYALFPLLRRLLVRLTPRSLWPAAAAALFTVWAVPLVAQTLPEEHQYWAIWLFPVARLPEFVAGMVLARIVREGRWPAVGVGPATAFAVVSYVASRWLPGDVRIVAGTAVSFAILIAAAAAADVDGRPTPWRSPRMVWLGEISYAFYLVHQLVLRLVSKVMGAAHTVVVEIGLALAAFLLALLASWLLYRAVEVPAMRALRPRRRARHRPARE